MKPKVQLPKVEWVQPLDFFILFVKILIDLGLSDKSLDLLKHFAVSRALQISPAPSCHPPDSMSASLSLSVQLATFIFDISFTCCIKRDLFQLALFYYRFGALY